MITITVTITEQIKGIKIFSQGSGIDPTKMEETAAADIMNAVTLCCIAAKGSGEATIVEGSGASQIADAIIQAKRKG